MDDLDKTYTYTVEESGTVLGVKNDPKTTRTIKLTIVKDQDDKIKVEKDISSDPIEFTNEYTPATFAMEGKKIITGREFKEGDQFTFTVSSPNGGKLPDPASETIEPTSGTEVSFAFNEIEYTVDDLNKEYTYVVHESGSGEGVTNDSNDHIVKVKIELNDDGTIKASETYNDGKHLTFTNTYEAKPTTVKLEGKKIITGREFQTGDEFTFTVTSPDGGKLPEQAAETIRPTSGYEASFEFDEIEFTKDDVGTYTYEVTESGSGKGVTNDSNTHVVRIEVKDNLDGTLSAQPVYDDGKHLEFHNTYETKPDTAVIEGKKIITGRAFKKGDEFTFKVTSPDGGKLPDPAEITIYPASGYEASFTFSEIPYTFDDAGKTYTYIVKESGHGDGVTNDTNDHEVRITVTDNLDGTLTAEPTYDDGKHLTFTNIYNATPAKAKIEGEKIITGRQFQEGDKFTFTVASTNGGKLPKPATATVSPTSGYAVPFEFA